MDKIKFKGKYFTDHKDAVHLSDARVQEMIKQREDQDCAEQTEWRMAQNKKV